MLVLIWSAGSTNSQIPINFQEAMNSWMSESSAYCANGVAGPGQPQTGHFTQVSHAVLCYLTKTNGFVGCMESDYFGSMCRSEMPASNHLQGP